MTATLRQRPEDVIAEAGRPFTGAEYLESLRDGREVWFEGEKVSDVTRHPALRNAARSIGRLYESLHDPLLGPKLCVETDTGSGGRTHAYFRVPRSVSDLRAAREAIATWARLSYGWLGRSPDYKAAFTNTLGAVPGFYGAYRANAEAWYRRAQETVPFLNHSIVNPPVDRHLPVSDLKDVCVHVERETDSGIIVSGAKVVATSAALTHYNFIGQTPRTAGEDPDLAVSFIVPINAPGVKLLCRASHEYAAQASGSPFDNPLSSRFDENDAIIILDRVEIPHEDIFIYRDPKQVARFLPQSGFLNGFLFHGCTRFAVKLDFLTGLLSRALKATGAAAHRGNQILLGEALAWRHAFWSLSDAMASNPQAWGDGGAVLPQRQAALAYCCLAPECYPRIREIIQRACGSGLVYLPSSAADLLDPEVDALLRRFVRGSNGISHTDRIKTLKLLWDAVGSGFAGRHELYERCYAGGWEEVRLLLLADGERGGVLPELEAFAGECLGEYGIDGWHAQDWAG